MDLGVGIGILIEVTKILGAFGGVRESLGCLLGLFWLSGGRNLQPNWGQQDGAGDNLELEISSVAGT